AVPAAQKNFQNALFTLGFMQIRAKDLKGLSQTLNKIAVLLASLPRLETEELFLSAQLRMRYAALALAGQTGLTPEQNEDRLRQPDLAVHDLQKAIVSGLADPGRIKNDPLFASLRTHKNFEALVAGLDSNRMATNAPIVHQEVARPSAASE